MNIILVLPLVTLPLLSLSSSSGTSLPNHYVNHGESLTDLGITEYDSRGNPVNPPGGILSSTDNHFPLDWNRVAQSKISLAQGTEMIPMLVKIEFRKRHKVSDLLLPPYLSMAAIYHGIGGQKFAEFLVRQRLYNNVKDANNIKEDVIVAGNISMRQLKTTANELQNYFEFKQREAGSRRSGLTRYWK